MSLWEAEEEAFLVLTSGITFPICLYRVSKKNNQSLSELLSYSDKSSIWGLFAISIEWSPFAKALLASFPAKLA